MGKENIKDLKVRRIIADEEKNLDDAAVRCTGLFPAGRLRYKPGRCGHRIGTGVKWRQIIKTTKNSNAEYTSEVFAMDTYMTLTAYGENAKEAVEAGIAEIQRLDALLSTGDANSEVAQINQNGGGTLSEDTDYLVKRALAIYQSTQGAFDISIYPVMQLWGFTTGDFAVPREIWLQNLHW